ncbi:MAG: hypothetical protein ACO1QS_12700 [Verrucomicrobiota bacterium]
MQHPHAPADRRWSSALLVILLMVILLLLLKPAATSNVGLDRRRALLEEAVRQRDEVTVPAPVPASKPFEPAPAVPVVVMAIPPPAAIAPRPQVQPPQNQDAYLESVQRYLRNLELRHYDELARRKQNFEEQMQNETGSIARQMEQLANFKAPPARVELSPHVKRSLTYCLSCHERRSNVEIAEFFDRAGNFFH